MGIVREDMPHGSSSPGPVPVSGIALRLLLEAYACARDLGCDMWEFAVEGDTLRDHGLTNTQLRWLLRKGYIAQAVEKTLADAPQRSFRQTASPSLHQGGCFVLTESGVGFAAVDHLASAANAIAKSQVTTKPVWDADLRELRLGEALVKRFKQPAANQELILEAFQEEGWPSRIDDPLPPASEQNSKQRLHSTISNLNRCQETRLIHFEGGGDGKSVCWRFFHSSSDGRAKTERV
jgi:hypothetical protein